MSLLAETLAEIRAGTGAVSLHALARRLGVSRDDLDAAIGYWVYRGELIVEEAGGCSTGRCSGCALADRGCGPARSGPGLLMIRPARRE